VLNVETGVQHQQVADVPPPLLVGLQRLDRLADVSYDGTVTMVSLANPPRPARAATMQTVTARR